MSKGQAEQNTATATVPFRILPSHGPRLAWIFILAAAGAFLWYFLFAQDEYARRSVLEPIGLSHLPDPVPLVIYVSLLLVIVALGYARERLYFRPGSSYWVGVTADGLKFSTPFRFAQVPWSKLTSFQVQEHKQKSHRWYTVDARRAGSGLFSNKISVRGDDFATGLTSNKLEAAQILCSLLNKARGRMLDSNSHPGKLTIGIPAGLLVAAGTPAGARQTTASALRQTASGKEAVLRTQNAPKVASQAAINKQAVPNRQTLSQRPASTPLVGRSQPTIVKTGDTGKRTPTVIRN